MYNIVCLDPIYLAALGTLLVVGSVVITGPYISRIENSITGFVSAIQADDDELTSAQDAIQKSYRYFFPAEIKLLILQTASKPVNNQSILWDVSTGVVRGICERYVAATGEGPSEEQFKKLNNLAIQASTGDQDAFSKLNNKSAELISEWAKRHERIVNERNEKKKKVTSLKSKINFWRNTSVTLQVVGLIVVLLKDVFST